MVTGDLAEMCGDAGPDCTLTGSSSATAAQVTIDPDEGDGITMGYSIAGSPMTWSGSIGGTPATFVWDRA